MKLVLTTATEGMPEEQEDDCPEAGGLFEADAGVSVGCAHKKYSCRVSAPSSVGPGGGSAATLASRAERDSSARVWSRNRRQATVISHAFGSSGGSVGQAAKARSSAS